jgi:hypothetical protein
MSGLAVNAICPWSGEPVRADSLTLYRGASVGFCNPGCRDKFAAAVTAFDHALNKAGPTLFQLAGAAVTPARLNEAVLVIIDAQEEYRSGALPLDGIDAALARLCALLAAARAAGTPVMHVVHKGKPGGMFDAATGRDTILPEVQPLPGEVIVDKTLPKLLCAHHFAGEIAGHRAPPAHPLRFHDPYVRQHHRPRGTGFGL